ncbi:unnamed protein product [Adineta ricciae]|uniref:C2H2-type domain-containing protein n=1 Tax=Adineta ricciae TaxID=249248 RepID=A0A814M716_ADIRI|nr:unnamed protein product [Adineta ricciae]
MCILTVSTTSKNFSSTRSFETPSMHSPRDNLSIDDQQDLSSDTDNNKPNARTNTPSSTTGNRSDADSPFRSYALIETDSIELDRIIDVLRQFFPNTRIVECNNSSSTPSRTPSRSSSLAAPQQQASIESNSSLRVPTSTANRYRSHSQSVSEKSSFESDHLQIPTIVSTDTNDSSTFNANSQIFKGKVKDYLQRRYLEQINEHQTRKDTFMKCRSDDSNYRRLKRDSPAELVQSFEHISKPEHHHYTHAGLNSSTMPTTIKAHSFDSSAMLLQHSVSDTNLCYASSATDTSFPSSQNGTIVRSQSKRRLLQRGATIDMEDSPALNVEDEQMTSPPTSPITNEKSEAGKITFSIEHPDDDNNNNNSNNGDDNNTSNEHESAQRKSLTIPTPVHHPRKSRPFRHSYSDQQTTDDPNTNNHNTNFLVPYRHSFDHQHNRRMLPTTTITPLPFNSGMTTPLAPHSAVSDPGPYHTLWSHTPPNTYGLANFHFPKSQEHLITSAQGSIAQLSSLTKILCNEPSVFTPITPRFKAESQEPNSMNTVPQCQICRQQFDSRQTYLAHYRTHLENSNEDDKVGLLDYNNVDNNSERPGESRNYSCKICLKRFSRSDMLNRHLRLHSGIRPYRCAMCNTHFSRSDHLSTHLRTHTGEKPYTCPECSYAACRRDMITRHLKVHSKQRSERKNATSSMGSSNES